jgi:hypothetical protein
MRKKGVEVNTMKAYKVGQIVVVKLSGGRIVEAEIKAVVQTTDGLRFNVSFQSEAAMIYEWQIAEAK